MNSSQSITKLAASLVLAQKNIGAAVKGSANPFFKSKYADLGAVMEACKGPLLEQGITVMQLVGKDGESAYLETILIHESGEWISDKMPIVAIKQNDPQAMGSAISYARRYALQSACFIPAEDDDGESAMQRHKQPTARQEQKPQSSPSEEKKTPPRTTSASKEASPQKLRDRMIAVLLDDYEQALCEDYGRKAGILAPEQRLTDWPDDALPKNAAEMGNLKQRISWFGQGMSMDDIIAEEMAKHEAAKKDSIEWRDEITPYGDNKGVRLGDLEDKDLRYFVEKFEVKPGKYEAQNRKLRNALDAAGKEKGWM